jgi:hypothetical protein
LDFEKKILNRIEAKFEFDVKRGKEFKNKIEWSLSSFILGSKKPLLFLSKEVEKIPSF